jgi:hypothetical protein
MAKGGRKSFEARNSAIAGVSCDREPLGRTKSAEERKLLGLASRRCHQSAGGALAGTWSARLRRFPWKAADT